MFDLSPHATALIQKEIVDIEVRIRLLEHKNDLLDEQIAAKVAERDAIANENRSAPARKYRQDTVQQEIDKLHARQDKIVEELDDLELQQLFYKQEIGWAEKP